MIQKSFQFSQETPGRILQKTAPFNQNQALPGELEIRLSHFAEKYPDILQILRSGREHFHSDKVTRLCDRDVDLRHHLQELRSSHDLQFDSNTGHQKIDLDSSAILIDGRRDEPDRGQTAVGALDRGAFRMIRVSTHPKNQRHSFGLLISRYDEDYVKIPRRPGFGSEGNRESPDEGVAEAAGPEVGIQPDQCFLEACQRGWVPSFSGTYGRFSNHALKRCRISSSFA